ncbi:MAG TPA: carboxypeptidase-like regulatory domain-containing protein, partial [Pilimelia sp.]|nr:carboxypeptidase-like regulatory domain-containing protein [Pilimelia sp.]
LDGGDRQYAPRTLDESEAAEYPVTTHARTTVHDILLPTGRLVGTVRQPDGAPAAEHPVHLDREHHRAVRKYTDHEGSYAARVFAGTFTVALPRDDEQHVHQWIPGQRDEARAARFVVPAGGTVRADDTLVVTGSAAVTFTDAAGRPLADVPVSLHTDDEDGSYADGATDSAGRYTFGVLMPGRYKVRFALDGDDEQEQWAPGKATFATGDWYEIKPGATTPVTDRRAAGGVLAGTLKKADGKPHPNLWVTAHGRDGREYGAATDDAGRYRFPYLPLGEYKISYGEDNSPLQFAAGKGNLADATVYPLAAGKTTTVNDKLAARATLTITPKDPAKKPVKKFCAFWDAPRGEQPPTVCTKNGKAVLKDGMAGRQRVVVVADGYANHTRGVNLTWGKSLSISPGLTAASVITTTVTDRASGKPVKDACVRAEGEHVNPDPRATGPEGCSDASGKVRIPVEPGRYQLLALPKGRLGAQWVTAKGGTGRKENAAVVAPAAGKTVAAPAVALDPAGKISGRVTLRDGSPAEDLSVSADFHHDGGHTDADGRYTLAGFGPYEWPVHIYADGPYPQQWSGGAGNRREATAAKVTAGKTARLDTTLRAGVRLRVAMTLGGRPAHNPTVYAFDPLTGDTVASAGDDLTDTVEMTVFPGREVRLLVEGTADWSTIERWHGGADFGTATKVPVGDGDTEVVVALK